MCKMLSKKIIMCKNVCVFQTPTLWAYTFITFYYKYFLLSGSFLLTSLLISYVNIKNVFMKLFF